MQPKTTSIICGLSILALTACGGGGSGGGGSSPPASSPPLPAGTAAFTDTCMNGAPCNSPFTICSKGIVGGGFSQGSVLATLAKNFDSRVRAARALAHTYRIRAST